MAQRSAFQSFVPFAWKRWRSSYSFLSRFEKAFCVAIPKASSFYCGVSPSYQKHVIFDLQHSSKAWAVGEFFLNVHISTELKPTENWLCPSSGYEQFDNGYYRLPLSVDGRDIAWCLTPGGSGYMKRVSDRFLEYREASQHEDTLATFVEVADDVAKYLEDHLFGRAGFSLG